MTRKALLALILAATAAAAAPAQNWADKMFTDGVNHDFGVVPHGAQLFHRFAIKNIYAVRMEITTITPGCGCVTATAPKRVLDPNEETTLDVSMDARRFTGPKAVIVRVTVGPTFTSSADVKVSAVSRADVVFNPGDVAFGAVDHGQADYTDRRSRIRRPARLAPRRGGGRQGPAVRRRPDGILSKAGQGRLPDHGDAQGRRRPGPLRETLYLKTNDPTSPTLPLQVTGEVQRSCRCRRPS